MATLYSLWNWKLDEPSMSKDFSALHIAVNSLPQLDVQLLFEAPRFSRAVSHFLLCYPRVLFEARTPARTVKQPYSSHTFLSWGARSLGTQHSALRVQNSNRTRFYGLNLFTYDCSVGNHGTPRPLRTQRPGQWPERVHQFLCCHQIRKDQVGVSIQFLKAVLFLCIFLLFIL